MEANGEDEENECGATSEPDTIEKRTKSECTNAGKFIEDILAKVNASNNISDALTQMDLMQGTVVGANSSFSAQSSTSNSDPRLYVKTKCGYLTFTLFGKSLEYAVQHQNAEIPLPKKLDEEASGVINSQEDGEILVQLSGFPRTDKATKQVRSFSGKSTINQWNPHFKKKGDHPVDTQSCTTCHKDVEVTKGPLGMKPIRVNGEEISAIVSPYYRQFTDSAEMDLYCIPKDLQLLYRCHCSRLQSGHEKDAVPKDCSKFEPVGLPFNENKDRYQEACARIDAITKLNPRQHCRFDPRIRKEKGEAGTCFSSE